MKKHIDRIIDRIGTNNMKYMIITIPPYVVMYFILLDVLGRLTQIPYNTTSLLAGIPPILLMAYRLLNKPNNWKPSRLMHLHTAAIWAIIFAHTVHNASGGIAAILALGILCGFLVLFQIIAAITTDTSNSTNDA